LRFLKYLLVGGSATVLHYAVLLGVVEGLHGDPAVGAGLGAFVGALWAYGGNRRFTFSDSDASHARTLPRFLSVALLMALGHGGFVWLGTAVGAHYMVAQLVASGLALVVGYRLNKRWSFA